MSDNQASISGFFARTETHNFGGFDFTFNVPTAEDAALIDKKQMELAKVMPSDAKAKMSEEAVKAAREFQVLCIKSVLRCSEEDARRIVISTGQKFYSAVSAFLGLDGIDAGVSDDPS